MAETRPWREIRAVRAAYDPEIPAMAGISMALDLGRTGQIVGWTSTRWPSGSTTTTLIPASSSTTSAP